MSPPPNVASVDSPPPHVNDFYEKQMMLESLPKGREGEENGERARKGGSGEEGGGAHKAEVGVVFPVNTELQLVRGEGLRRGNVQKHTAGRKKNLV